MTNSTNYRKTDVLDSLMRWIAETDEAQLSRLGNYMPLTDNQINIIADLFVEYKNADEIHASLAEYDVLTEAEINKVINRWQLRHCAFCGKSIVPETRNQDCCAKDCTTH